MKLWRFIMAMEFRKILAYRSDFWITFIGQTLISLLIARALWQNIFESQGVSEMNGFTLPMITLYYLIATIGTKILSGENIGFISREIYDGSFTRYLIYPLSFLEFKSITYLTYSLFYSIHLIIIFTLYQLFFNFEQLTPMTFLSLLAGVGIYLVAALTYLMISAFIELLALWAENIWSLLVMLRFFVFFLGGGTLPLNFYPLWAQDVLRFTPFPYLINLPVKAAMGMMTGEQILTGVGILFIWAIFFRVAVGLLWTRGQLNYTGVGI